MKRTSSVIPFGYKLSETNYSELEEVPEQKEALKKIVPMIQQRTLSLREGSAWIEYETGRSISHMGLKKIAEKYAE
jgi:archaellum component FlaC